MTSGSSVQATLASGPARSTRRRHPSTPGTGPASRCGTGTSVQSTLTPSRTSTSSLEDSRASLSRLLAAGWGLGTPGVRCLAKQCGWQNAGECRIYSLKTYPEYYRTTTGTHSTEYSLKWMKAGMMRSGNVLTGNISFRRTGSACSLWDVLDARVPDKYFRSRKMVELHREYLRQRESGKSMGFLLPPLLGLSLRTTSRGRTR